MHILGLNIGHNSTACLLTDGRVAGSVSEERFSRIKNQSGVPILAVKYLLNEAKISMNEIDYVVLDDHYDIMDNRNFTQALTELYSRKSFYEKLLSKIGYSFPELFKKYSRFKEGSMKIKSKKRKDKLALRISKKFDIPKEKVLVIEHHLAHALAPCFNARKNGKTLVFTLDGEGSGICGSVSIFDGKNLQVISRTKKRASLGYLYAITTLFLGMKPAEHEFKVMGLAPYAKADKVEEVYKKIKDLIWLNDNLEFESKFNMPFADYFFTKEMKFARFDNIAGAVQKLVEELTAEWVKKAVKKTGIKNIALSGGVFMNVKACQKISELNEVESLFVMPSSGDESNAIGCCFYGYRKYCGDNNLNFKPEPLAGLYLGPEYDDEYIAKLIKEKNLDAKYKISKFKNINSEVARLLAKNKIVARCSGKSEWGARALGNRSILANPSNEETIRILNETIKDRDFWMPFTPSILDKFEKKYLINKKNLFAPYMVITFNPTELAKKHLKAAMHPYDFTIRPQIVTKDYSKDYYEILEKFSKLTGIGGVLNTSFNLHGEPNVLTPEDALRTVEHSDLKYLAMGSYLFEKK